MPEWMWTVLVWIGATALLLLGVLFPLLQHFLREYLATWAKGFATREQAEQLLAEQRRNTEATETIKAEIGGGLWQNQQRWSRRLDVLVDLVEYLDALTNCAHKAYLSSKDPEVRVTEFYLLRDKARENRPKLRSAVAASRILFRSGLRTVFEESEKEITSLAMREHMNKSPGHFAQLLAITGMIAHDDLEEAARSDLEAFTREEQRDLDARHHEQRARTAVLRKLVRKQPLTEGEQAIALQAFPDYMGPEEAEPEGD